MDPSPCTRCKCAPDPCLTKTCPRGKICVVTRYTPCAIVGRCGFTAQCIRTLSTTTRPTIKPNNCPDYWPGIRGQASSGYLKCNTSDGECPGVQKCCAGPQPVGESISSSYPNQRYCTDPCVSMGSCNVNCPLGLVVNGGCNACQCNPDPCTTYACPIQASNRTSLALQTATKAVCETIKAPCNFYPGAPPCAYMAYCRRLN